MLASDWEYVTYKGKSWKPNDGDSYYYICSSGVISNDTFSEGWSQDKLRRDFCNAFKTEEESKKMIEKIKIINRLRELSNINFGNDSSQLKYSIGYDIDTKKVYPTINRYTRIMPFEVYFETAKDCQNAINEIGEENLKKYYFDVVE